MIILQDSTLYLIEASTRALRWKRKGWRGHPELGCGQGRWQDFAAFAMRHGMHSETIGAIRESWDDYKNDMSRDFDVPILSSGVRYWATLPRMGMRAKGAWVTIVKDTADWRFGLTDAHSMVWHLRGRFGLTMPRVAAAPDRVHGMILTDQVVRQAIEKHYGPLNLV